MITFTVNKHTSHVIILENTEISYPVYSCFNFLISLLPISKPLAGVDKYGVAYIDMPQHFTGMIPCFNDDVDKLIRIAQNFKGHPHVRFIEDYERIRLQ